MAQIGSVNCTFVRGSPPTPKMRMELWRVPGVNGYGAQALGLSEAEFKIIAVFYSNAAGVENWKNSLEELQGQIVTIINDLGATFVNCLLTKVGNMKNTAAVVAGGITQRGEIEIEGVVTQ